MALGAQAKDILRLIFSQTGSMIGLGLVIGVAGALGVTHLIASLLFNVGTRDPLTFIGIPLLLGFVGLLSCWFLSAAGDQGRPDGGALRARVKERMEFPLKGVPARTWHGSRSPDP